MSLVKILTEKGEHGLLNSIINEGNLVPVGVIKTLEILSESKIDGIELADLYKADYDKIMVKAMTSIIGKTKDTFIKKNLKKILKEVNGDIPDDNVNNCHLSFANGQLSLSFGCISITYFVNKDGSHEEVQLVDDNKYGRIELFMNKEELDRLFKEVIKR